MKKENWFENVENRNHPWPGLTWLTTAICVSDVKRAVDFYTETMGMISIAELNDDNGVLLFARIRYRGINFTINKENWDSDLLSPLSSGQATSFIFYLYVDDVKQIVKDMVNGGASILNSPEKMFWGDFKARIKDPFGYIWDIAQKL